MPKIRDLPADDTGLLQFPVSGVPRPVYDATRALLHINMTSEALGVLARAVRDLGGEVAADSVVVEDGDLVEVSLGHSLRLRARAPEGSAVRQQLEKYLPLLAEDAERILKVAHGMEQLARIAEIDPVTGLPNHHSMSRLVSRLEEGDLIITINLDGAWESAAAHGPEAWDETAQSFARALRHAIRVSDYSFRMSDRDFLVVMRDEQSAAADKFLVRVQDLFERERPGAGGFSAGVAVVARGGWRTAVRAAGRALSRVRQSGANHWEVALESDYTDDGEAPEAAVEAIAVAADADPEPTERTETVAPSPRKPRRQFIFPARAPAPRASSDKR